MAEEVCTRFVNSVLIRQVDEFAGGNGVLQMTYLLSAHLITLLHIRRDPPSVRNPLFLKSMTSVGRW
jgi:hypothetical protein